MNETHSKLDQYITKKIDSIIEYSVRVEENVENINIKLNLVEEKLNLVEEKLNVNEKKLDKISESSDNMDHHINFIDNIYDNVKYPLNFMVNKVNRLANYSNSNLIEK